MSAQLWHFFKTLQTKSKNMQKLCSVFWYNSCENSYLFTHCLLDQSLFLSFRHPSGPTTYFPDRSLLSSFSFGNDQPSIFVGILSIIFLSFFSFIVCMDIDGRWLLTIVRAGIPTIRPMVKLGRTMMISEDDDQFWRIRIGIDTMFAKHCFLAQLILSYSLIPFAASMSTNQNSQQQFMTAPQCRCRELEECAKEIEKLVAKCKMEPKCETHLKKIGNPQKIRQCLADEQKDMEKLEQCVEKAVGPIGCTNDEHPKNLTVPVIPDMMSGGLHQQPRLVRDVPALPATQEQGHAPPELSDFLMCVDQCAVQSASPDAAPTLCATREGNMNCAFKLKCALMPPNERQEKAFADCEQKLGLGAQKRLKKSCQCLKAAGVRIVCPP